MEKQSLRMVSLYTHDMSHQINTNITKDFALILTLILQFLLKPSKL